MNFTNIDEDENESDDQSHVVSPQSSKFLRVEGADHSQSAVSPMSSQFVRREEVDGVSASDASSVMQMVEENSDATSF